MVEFLMTGEGPTDYGRKAFQTGKWVQGPAAVFVRKCADSVSVPISLSFADRKDVENVKLGQRNLRDLEGKAVPARRFYVYMREQGFQNGIYYCDADRDSGARNTEQHARDRFSTVYAQVKKGANPKGSETCILPMVALRMIESWLLSDENALCPSRPGEKGRGKASGGKGRKTIEFPQSPEMVWGDKHNPESNYPKHYLSRLYRNLHNDTEPGTEEYIQIAEATDIDKLTEKCPISFKSFRREFTDCLTAR